MAEYLSPGVYVEEIDSAPRAIEGVGTSTAGFVGMTVKGPTIGTPSLCTNFADFMRQFGGYLSEYTHGDYRFLPNSVESFFNNGGTRCFVSRVIPGNATCAYAEQGPLRLRAANEGKWGNRIIVNCETANRRKLQLVSKQEDRIYVARNTATFAEGDIVVFGGEINRIETIFDNTVTFEQDFKASPIDAALVPKKLVYSVELDMTIRYENDVETYTGLCLNPASKNYVAERLSNSNLVTVASVAPIEGIQHPVTALFNGKGATKGSISFAGGTDGTLDAVNESIYVGRDEGPGKRTGINSFKENAEASILAVPGITMPDVIVSLVNHCEQTQSRFAILDVPKALVKTSDIADYRSMIDSTYAAIYHPWIQTFDPITKKPGFIPPSGAMAGIYSRTDITRGVHKAPANEGVVCTGLSINYNTGEQDLLNPIGVNLIRAIPGQGIRVWGARTASNNASFKYVNIRRLFIYIEQSIRTSTNWVVFEPNNAALWSRVQMTISGFLESAYRVGMLNGETPAQAFFVNVGTSTMSRDDIMNGRLICEIGIAPSRPAEFVIFRVSQMTADAES